MREQQLALLNFALGVLHARATGEHSNEGFIAFAEVETAYFINFYLKWIAVSRPNRLVVAYEDLIDHQEQTPSPL